jgi:peptidoglycan hydrolase-like protein with peptidoglycan-binding domain
MTVVSGGGLVSKGVEFNVLARWLRRATLLVAGVCVPASALRAGPGTVRTDPPAKAGSSIKSTTHGTKKGVSRSSAKSAAGRTSHGASKSKPAKPSQNSHNRDEFRRSAMRPEPQRVQEIQTALIQAGEFHGEPTGTWDEATRDAMKRYQERHGFSVTGLPDSKSLMEMGLGPHPLPPDVATSAVSSTNLGPPIPSSSLSGPESEDRPSNADTPRPQP